jgi:hypothetical protein
MDIKKELENRLLGAKMTLLEMDNAVLDVLELEEENSYPRVKNSIFARGAFETAEIIRIGNFVYAASESFFDIFFEAADSVKADTFDIIVKITKINEL